MSEGKTVRVRIAVAVDRHGHWAASGASDLPDDSAHGTAVDCCPGDEANFGRYFVEADIPIPTEETIAGEVTE